jgi:hypothetical protein
MPNLDAPARLVFWPECHGEQGGDYDTLRQALAEAAQRPTETPWIVTLSGKILRPREISELIRTLQDDSRGDPAPSRH